MKTYTISNINNINIQGLIEKSKPFYSKDDFLMMNYRKHPFIVNQNRLYTCNLGIIKKLLGPCFLNNPDLSINT